LFVGPSLLALTMVVLIPFLIGIFYTFTNWNGANPNYDFIGFSNYSNLFKDSQFFYSFYITIVYTISSVVSLNLIGFVLAYFDTRNIKTKNFLRTGFFMPNRIGGLILGVIWQFLFNSVFTTIGAKLEINLLSTSLLQEKNTAILA